MQNRVLGLKSSATIPFKMLDKVLIVLVELYICIKLALNPAIILLVLVDHQVSIVMVMIEVDIGLRPANFFHITMAT